MTVTAPDVRREGDTATCKTCGEVITTAGRITLQHYRCPACRAGVDRD